MYRYRLDKDPMCLCRYIYTVYHDYYLAHCAAGRDGAEERVRVWPALQEPGAGAAASPALVISPAIRSRL